VNTSQPFRNLAEVLRRKAIQPERLLSGDCLTGIENASVCVLSPYREELLCQIGGRNERSVVLLVECQGLRVLLTGDINEEVESNLVEEGCELNCDILKVAHHGSSYSSSERFLRAASPDIAVISCGENSFGHPSPPALKRLEVSGAEVLTTQEKGTVHVEWKDGVLKIHTRR
jgi:competence protein ComEC